LSITSHHLLLLPSAFYHLVLLPNSRLRPICDMSINVQHSPGEQLAMVVLEPAPSNDGTPSFVIYEFPLSSYDPNMTRLHGQADMKSVAIT